MKKKMIALSLAVALIVVAAIGGTMAYFTDNEDVTNTFTMGNVDITLTEAGWQDISNAAPGITYAKEPVVTNVGANPAWVRVDVTLSDAKAFMGAAAKYDITDLSTIFSGHVPANWTLVEAPAYDVAADTLTYKYYYNTMLEKNQSTGALFTAVKIPAKFNNADMSGIGDFTIRIQAHAIQNADGFTSPQTAFAGYVFEAK